MKALLARCAGEFLSHLIKPPVLSPALNTPFNTRRFDLGRQDSLRGFASRAGVRKRNGVPHGFVALLLRQIRNLALPSQSIASASPDALIVEGAQWALLFDLHFIVGLGNLEANLCTSCETDEVASLT